MRKLALLMAALLAALLLAACGGGAAASGSGVEIAMVPDAAGVEDGAHNQAIWHNVWMFCNVQELAHNFYQPRNDSDDAAIAAIDKAVKNGARLVFVPGTLTEVAQLAQKEHPDTFFAVIDAGEEEALGENEKIAAIQFAEEQAGYLAALAAVQEGYRQFGFIGGEPTPATVRYGFGYVQGLNAAAAELPPDDDGAVPASDASQPQEPQKGQAVELHYTYTTGNETQEELYTLAQSWYEDGVGVIFACTANADLDFGIFSAASATGNQAIGSDIDQSEVSPAVLVSAEKSVGVAVGRLLEAYAAGTFTGGRQVFGVEQKAVGLTMRSSRLKRFHQKEYDAAYAKLQDEALQPYRWQPGDSVSPLDFDPPFDFLRTQYDEVIP